MSNIRKRSKYLAITVLIGGKSSRFGTDKGLFQVLGKPLISYQLEVLEQLDYNIFLVAHSNEQVQNYIDKIDITPIMGFIIDDHSHLANKNIKSPMIGLYSAFNELNKLGYEKTLVLPCDTPLIQKEVLNLLIESSKEYDCCIPQWNNGLYEPLIAIYPVQKSFKSAITNLKKMNFKLSDLLGKNWRINNISIEKSILIKDKNLLSFININKFTDLELINKFIRKKNSHEKS